MAEGEITFHPSRIDLNRARRDWRKAIRPIEQRDGKNRVVEPELEEDTDQRYERCSAIMIRLLGASNSRRDNNYGFVRGLIAEVPRIDELMILSQDYVAFATKHGMFDEAIEACTEILFPDPIARFEAYLHVVDGWPAFRTETHFARLRQLAEAIKNPDHDPGARHAAWQSLWQITGAPDDQARMEAERPPEEPIVGAVPQREIRTHA